MITVETHCHSHHSFDCNTTIESIVRACKDRCIDAIVICDHDVCDITEEETQLFINNNIRLLKAIEFTTDTDSHIIGISPNIRKLQKQRFHYTLDSIVNELNQIGATIVIPHPFHKTGIIGNVKNSKEAIELALNSARFVECENYRYGVSKGKLKDKYPHLRYLVGSDAHSSKNIGAFVNTITGEAVNILDSLYNEDIKHIKNKQHNRGYWAFRSFKRAPLYQFFLNCFSPELRRNIKNKLFNK